MKILLKVIVLENCPYSMSAVELLSNYNIPFKKIMVNQNTKHKYKTDKISTFPQVYIVNKDEELLLGGYVDIEEIMDLVNKYKNLNNIKTKLNIKYPNFDNKQILRIIEIFAKSIFSK